MTADPKHDALAHVSRPGEPGRLIDADQHARQHTGVRKAHETELIEDYVELIADLIDATGEARAVDIAQRMGVRQATVTAMVRRLQARGLATSEPYRSIFLTDAGRELANDSRARHAVVLRFLLAIGVPESVAFHDAEGIEHHVSATTLRVLEDWMKRLETDA
ncbi:manganese-binding transcriptional regulator MntR [Thalassobaculum sp.]|uniref:manganese-binding transcriptional regulator MntR n=1 Tax=Thalassobaculum sp. TaxID=2022740 RepID=UPI0032EDEAB8